jgi:hypothetical protein
MDVFTMTLIPSPRFLQDDRIVPLLLHVQVTSGTTRSILSILRDDPPFPSTI